MAKPKRRSKKLLEADRFRARVVSLLRVPHSDWRDWEYEWLRAEARRAEDYIYTDKERVILNQLIACSTMFRSYSEWSIQEMLNAVYPYRADLDEEGEEFLEQLHRWGATDLKVRQISRLAMLCRTIQDFPRDTEIEDVRRETRTQDDTEQLGGGYIVEEKSPGQGFVA